jgi:hypothetical protein
MKAAFHIEPFTLISWLLQPNDAVRRPRLLESNLHDSLQIHRNPRLLTDLAHADLDFPERGLDRGSAVSIGDGRCPASDEPTPTDHNTQTAARVTVAVEDDDCEHSLE